MVRVFGMTQKGMISEGQTIPAGNDNEIVSFLLSSFFDSPNLSNKNTFSVPLFRMFEYDRDFHPYGVYSKLKEILLEKPENRPLIGDAFPVLGHWDKGLRHEGMRFEDIYNIIIELVKNFFKKYGVRFNFIPRDPYSYDFDRYEAIIELPKNILLAWAEKFFLLDKKAPSLKNIPMTLEFIFPNSRNPFNVYVDMQGVINSSGNFLSRILPDLGSRDFLRPHDPIGELLIEVPIRVPKSHYFNFPDTEDYFLYSWKSFYEKWEKASKHLNLPSPDSCIRYFVSRLKGKISNIEGKKLYKIIASNIIGLDYLRVHLKKSIKDFEIGIVMSGTTGKLSQYGEFAKIIENLVGRYWRNFYYLLEFFCVALTLHFFKEKIFFFSNEIDFNIGMDENISEYYYTAIDSVVNFIAENGKFGRIPSDFVKLFINNDSLGDNFGSYRVLVSFEKIYICFLDILFEELAKMEYSRNVNDYFFLLKKISFDELIRRGKKLIRRFWVV